MSNDAYQNAVAKRDELKRELNIVEEFLALYQQFESTGSVLKTAIKPTESKQNTPDSGGATNRRKQAKKISPSVLKEVAIAVLKEAGTPLSRRQIVNAIEAKNYSIPSKNKTGYLGSLLFRFKDVVSSTDNKGYWFTGYEAPNAPDSHKN